MLIYGVLVGVDGGFWEQKWQKSGRAATILPDIYVIFQNGSN